VVKDVRIEVSTGPLYEVAILASAVPKPTSNSEMGITSTKRFVHPSARVTNLRLVDTGVG